MPREPRGLSLGAGIAIGGVVLALGVVAAAFLLRAPVAPRAGTECAQWEREAQAVAQLSAASFPERFNFAPVPQHDPEYLLAIYRAEGAYQAYRFEFRESDNMREVGDPVSRPASCAP